MRALHCQLSIVNCQLITRAKVYPLGGIAKSARVLRCENLFNRKHDVSRQESYGLRGGNMGGMDDSNDK